MNRLDAGAPTTERNEAGFVPLREALEQMAIFVESAGDAEQSGKFRELSAKLEKGLLTVAFCGHFSAGKSTLVNALCGAPLLPSSPIPTSANVVTIVNGEPSARMAFRDADGFFTQQRPIPVAELHDFAVDGEGVASIEISYPVALLADRMAIMDTPGVDSTDSAHRAATESALHLADVVFYVTDYNHVLSDVNFRFLRSLAEWGKPTYVIVNQIDKHREEEVEFSAFHDGLRQAMESWRIDPAGILFLSLRQPDHPLSQWEQLLFVLTRLQPQRVELMTRSAVRSALFLAERFRDTLRTAGRQDRERLQDVVGEEEDGGGDSVATLGLKHQRLKEQIQQLQTAGDRRKEAIRAELDRLLANANLTPSETRDKAADVLDSLQPGFKAGWFAGAAKTDAERERRLTLLAEDFNRQISAHLNGHVRELLRRAAKEAGWDGEAMEASLQSAFEPATEHWLRSRVKPGMGADGQATLHYAAELSADMKAYYRKEALQWAEKLEERRQPEIMEARRQLERESAELAKRKEAASAIAALDEADETEKERLLALLPAPIADVPLALPEPAPLKIRHLSGSGRVESEKTAIAPEKSQTVDESAVFRLGAPAGTADRLQAAANLLSPLPALAKTAQGLADTAARLRNRQFTIALFGAFSAGKSSFANALAGLPALPVSPNPTTATINRIVGPTEAYGHGTALITMKSQEALLRDIRYSLRRLGVLQSDIDAAADHAAKLFELAGRLPAEDVHPRGKPHLSFLRAASEGWARYAERLGTQFTAEGEDYRRYAAEEQASCFVAEIDLFVDCPLTRGGAVLVDTPGADSINARHTGVAFEYIKNADAVLFVTYYNHAFTDADRQFLNQLGSVKDVFELDKMFFVINAADLAASSIELNTVKTHVETNLLKHGIRNPRLFAVSSLHGLQAKRAREPDKLQASGLAAFEAAFRHFAETELGGLAEASARKELERAGKQLEGWLQSATADTASREAEAQRLLSQAEQWRQRGAADLPAAALQPLLQEIAEQLYHLRQRVRFRFTEHFQTAFHPSVLQDDGRDLKKMLAACWADLKRSAAEDLLQELRAAGLRMEGALQRALEEKVTTAASVLAAEGFIVETKVRRTLELPFSEPFGDGPQLDTKRLWQTFKSPKHFFEKEGSQTLRDETADLIFQAADEWLTDVKDRWNAIISSQLSRSLADAYADLSAELASYAQSLGESMQRPDERRKLSELQTQWRNVVS